MRLNNTRQAALFLLLLLLFPYFSPPSTSSCPQPQFSAGFILQPTVFLYLFPPFLPICLTLSPRMHVISEPLQDPLGSLFPLPRGFTLFLMTRFASLYPLRFMSSFTVFIFALLCCIICCQVRLPVFVTHICKSLFKDDTLLFNSFPVYVCL